jgi:hypothetical protein
MGDSRSLTRYDHDGVIIITLAMYPLCVAKRRVRF